MNILIIGWAYPPRRGVSGMRAHVMAHELAALGHNVAVLTLDWRYPLPQPVPTPHDVVVAGLAQHPHVFAADRRWVDPRYEGENPAANVATLYESGKLRRAAHLARRLRWGSYPDWARAVLKLVPEILARWKPDVIWAISEGNSPHLVGHYLHRRYRIPWVADFKDPWQSGFRNTPFRFFSYRQWKAVLASAQCLTETCRMQATLDEADFGKAAQVIYTGYDGRLMASTPPRRIPGRYFVILYPGSIYPEQDWRLFFTGYAKFLKGEANRALMARFAYLGKDGEKLKAITRDFPEIETNFLFLGFKTPQEALAHQKGADLLLHVSNGLAAMEKKFLEYLASGTPVLCLPQGTTEDSEIGRSLPQYVEADTVEAIAAHLARLWGDWKVGKQARNLAIPLGIQPYSSQAQCALLESVLKRTVS